MNAWKSFRIQRVLICTLAATSLCAFRQAKLASACPFCSAASQTLSEELASAEVSVIAKLLKAAPAISPTEDDPAGLGANDPDSGKALFAIEEVLHGEEKIAGVEQIEVIYFGEKEQDKSFLINGIAGTPVDWTTPLPLSLRAVEYVNQLGQLPKKGPERLEFFLQYFEDEDPLLAQDAYDEFSRAPYGEITAMADRLDRERLTSWIENPEVGPTRRRLYLTLLGICGQESDIAMLEELLRYDYQQMKPGIAAMISTVGLHGSAVGVPLVDELLRADVRRKRQCLDALIAAYLKLKGPAGLPLIEELFLTNPAAEYTHVYATIMALRFHGEEASDIPRERLQESLRLVLDNEEIADQVIPDLARWEDWSILDRLVAMFKKSEKDAWIRQPVISYLLTAAEQPADVGKRANEALTELEELDPQGVKRARSYMAFGLLARGSGNAAESTEADSPQDAESTETKDAVDEQPAEEQPIAPASQSAETPSAETPPAEAGPKPAEQVAAATPAAVEASKSAENRDTPNRLMIIGVPLVAGLLLMGIFALLLRGSDLRSPTDGS